MSEERGPGPEYVYPDFRVLLGESESPEQTEDEDDRIATEQNREEEPLPSPKRPSLWRRFLGR